MAMPEHVGIVDLLVGLPGGDKRWWAQSMAPLLLDAESRSLFTHAAGYMFKDDPGPSTSMSTDDRIAELLREMDDHGIQIGLLTVDLHDEDGLRAIAEHPDRLVGCAMVDPNRSVHALRDLERAVQDHGVRAASFFPCGCVPQVPIDDRRAFPVYAKCCELGIPIFVNVGVPGPRVPMAAQKVARLDEVCWFFPELTVVMRHGAEPWEELAVKLMTKWPNLHYSTSAFAPRYYPRAIIDYTNSSRGADKVLYAGYYPSGLSFDRILRELRDLPLRDEVWPKFLRTNALRVLGLDLDDAG